VNKISNFKRSINFASAGVSNLALQKNCSLVQLTESKKSLLSSFQIAHVLMKRKKTFCEVESVTKLYLEIVANLLHGGKHSVDKVEQIPWFNNEHSMCYDYCHVGLRCTIGRMGMQQLLSGVNENKEVKKHCSIQRNTVSERVTIGKAKLLFGSGAISGRSSLESAIVIYEQIKVYQ